MASVLAKELQISPGKENTQRHHNNDKASSSDVKGTYLRESKEMEKEGKRNPEKGEGEDGHAFTPLQVCLQLLLLENLHNYLYVSRRSVAHWLLQYNYLDYVVLSFSRLDYLPFYLSSGK